MIILDKGDSQIVLYAKHHFARGEPLDDIRQLIAARAGIFYDAPISDLDIIIVLTGIVEELQIEHKMAEVPYMSEVVFGSRFGTNHEKRSAIERFVRATLHLFAGVGVRLVFPIPTTCFMHGRDKVGRRKGWMETIYHGPVRECGGREVVLTKKEAT